MFIKFEMWEEEVRPDSNQPVVFGNGIKATLDMNALRYRVLPVNIHAIVSYEGIQFETNCRPNTAGKVDLGYAHRILLATGKTAIVLANQKFTFEQIIENSLKAGGLVYDPGPSEYVNRHINK